MPRKPAHERSEAFLALHGAGWSDHRTARAFGVHQNVVRRWRLDSGLPANGRQFNRIRLDWERVRELHAAGLNDYEIARDLGADPSSICKWRAKQSLATNYEPSGPSEATLRAARKMLRLGASKDQVAEHCSIHRMRVQRIRRKMPVQGLRKVGQNNLMIAARVRKDPTIMRRITSAIGSRIPPDVQVDAVYDLYADVLEGKVAGDFIEKVAPSYRNRAMEISGNGYGRRSLEDPLGEDWTLGDTLDDPDALDELERAAEFAYDNDD
jgi:hypothetical protein